MTTFDKIRQWADDRGLIENSTPKAQMTKLWEEYDELQSAIRAMDLEEIKDAIGDCMVVLTIIEAQMGVQEHIAPWHSRKIVDHFAAEMMELSGCVLAGDSSNAILGCVGRVCAGLRAIAAMFNLSIEDCIDHAYDQIKDRKGHMNEAGVFVKEEA